MSPRARVRKRDGAARVRAIALGLPNVEEGTTFGFPAFKVRGKLLAWFPDKKEVEPGSLAVRMSIVEREFRIRDTPAVYYVTPHYQDYPAVLARVDRMDDAALRELLEAGHEFVARRQKRPKSR